MIFSLVARICQAWSGAGHMVIAAAAYRELSPATKATVNLILKSHPDYEKWAENFAGEKAGMDLGQFVFMQASRWPDEIRRKHSKYDHPHWHFIDYPLNAPRFAVEPGPAPEDDILCGIRQCERWLSDPAASEEERAIYLSWLIHLVGDLHQPLHCSTLVNSTYPNGDKGGNEFYVMPATKGIKLHSFWDGLLGTRNQARPQMNYATRLASEFPRRKLPELRNSAVDEWSLESRALAVEHVYLRGKLKGGQTADGAPALPNGYALTAKTVAERQAAIAGYRLGDEIRRYAR
jgi:hypothetical protein